jgi:hypothetical protein
MENQQNLDHQVTDPGPRAEPLISREEPAFPGFRTMVSGGVSLFWGRRGGV